MQPRRTLFAVALIALVLFASSARAADPWSTADKTAEAIYLALHTADWGQTRYAAARPVQFREQNTILGEHPSRKRVDSYFAATALLHLGVTHVLPTSWRPAFQYFWIGIETDVVAKNYRADIQFNF